MKNKRGGIIITIIIIFILIIIGLIWFLRNTDVKTTITFDFSEKSEDGIYEADKRLIFCLEKGHEIDFRINIEEKTQQIVCIDNHGNECDVIKYYKNECSLIEG